MGFIGSILILILATMLAGPVGFVIALAFVFVGALAGALGNAVASTIRDAFKIVAVIARALLRATTLTYGRGNRAHIVAKIGVALVWLVLGAFVLSLLPLGQVWAWLLHTNPVALIPVLIGVAMYAGYRRSLARQAAARARPVARPVVTPRALHAPQHTIDATVDAFRSRQTAA